MRDKQIKSVILRFPAESSGYRFRVRPACPVNWACPYLDYHYVPLSFSGWQSLTSVVARSGAMWQSPPLLSFRPTRRNLCGTLFAKLNKLSFPARPVLWEVGRRLPLSFRGDNLCLQITEKTNIESQLLRNYMWDRWRSHQHNIHQYFHTDSPALCMTQIIRKPEQYQTSPTGFEYF